MQQDHSHLSKDHNETKKQVDQVPGHSVLALVEIRALAYLKHLNISMDATGVASAPA